VIRVQGFPGAVAARALVLAIFSAAPLAAQGADWNREAELSASIFFGNSSQRVAAARLGISRADSTLEVSGGFRFTYADVESDDGVRAVNRRSWDVSTSVDLRPYARLSPFVFGTLESSLEKQIDLRWGAGGGTKLVFARDSVSEHSFSLALLAEQTTPRMEVEAFDDDVQARWSARHRIRGTVAAGVTFTSTTFYKPRLDDFTDYTIGSVNSLAVALNTSLSLTFTFIDTYDSEARLRGSESNNDGQILFGVKARI
jgi:hypothetical protein